MTFRLSLDQLLSNFFFKLTDVRAVAIVDREGLIIHSKLRNMNENFDDIIGSVTAFFDNFIKRIKLDVGSTQDYFNIMKMDDYKIYFANAGPEAILTVFTELGAIDNKLTIYSKHIASKIALLLSGEKIDVQIPRSVDLFANLRLDMIPNGEFMPVVLFLGNPGVGKTSLINKFVKNEFTQTYDFTIVLEISEKEIQLAQGCQIKFELWDIGGQVNLSPHQLKIYENVNMVLILIDITNRNSFDQINKWIDLIKKINSKSISYLLIVNKIDVPNRAINFEEIETKSNELNCPFIEVSAKDGTNIQELFQYLALKFISNS